MYVGLGAVALWLYVRLPRRRPQTLARAMAHVVLSFAVVLVLPAALAVVVSVGTGRSAMLVFVVGALMPALCYVLLSWFWLLGRVVGDVGGGTPRGGHPVTNSR
jgi:uncharacterized membrane protein